MPDEESNSYSFPWTALLALLAAGSGYFLIFPPVTSVRPAGASVKQMDAPFSDEDVDARLWQDPVSAIYESANDGQYNYSNHHADDPHSVVKFRDQVALKAYGISPGDPDFLQVTGTSRSNLIILPVFIAGGPYEEDVEGRLRDRVAVLEGLEASGFIADDARHIGYFSLPLPPTTDPWETNIPHPLSLGHPPGSPWARNPPMAVSTSGASTGNGVGTSQKLLIPYEWWHPKSPGTFDIRGVCPTHILVLWVPDDAFQASPFSQLGDLVSYFQWASYKTGTIDGPDIIVLGPDNSDTLSQMVKEVQPPNAIDDETRLRLCSTRIYSSKAAAADSIITGGTDTCENVLTNALRFSKATTQPSPARNDFHFMRTVIPDDGLVAGIYNELRLRGVVTKPDEKPDDIAIISEQDSYYARAVQQSFVEKFANQKFGPAGISERDWNLRKEDKFSFIYPYNYLRGIDGALPSDQTTRNAHNTESASSSISTPTSGNSTGPGASSGSSNSRSTSESAGTEGMNQADYLERLSKQICNLNNQLQEKRQMLKAVGVLGSDPYDKLEILEALRPKLRGTIFFTNHLDARYALPEEWNVTHNLIVVSSYGLTLNEFYQRGTPPFRDSFQTATYEATLEALGVIPEGLGSKGNARIFEVARSGFYDLSGTDPIPGAIASGTNPLYPDPNSLNGYWSESVSGLWSLHAMPRWHWVLLAIMGACFLYGFSTLASGHGCKLLNKDELRANQESVKGNGAARSNGDDLAEYQKPGSFAYLRGFIVGVLACLGISVIWCVLQDRRTFNQEPFSFFDGISIFPCFIIWRTALLLSIYLIFKAHGDLVKNSRHICRIFALPRVESPWQRRIGKWKSQLDGKSILSIHGLVFLKACLITSLVKCRQSLYARITSRGISLSVATLKALFLILRRSVERLCDIWPQAGHLDLTKDPPHINAALLWSEYQNRGFITSRLRRVLPMSILYFIVFALLASMLGGPPMWFPARGQHVMHGGINTVFQVALGCAPIVLTFYVVDATRLQVEFIRRLRQAPTSWPEASYTSFPDVSSKLKIVDFSSFLDLRLIAERTDAVNTLIYYPFIYIFLAMLSGISYFDDIPHPIGADIIHGFYLLLALYVSYRLPRAANDFRTETIAELQVSESIAENSLDCDGKDRAKALQRIIKRIQNLDQGVFVSLWQQPAIRAILLPSGGIGIWTLLQYLPH
jgi:hypothetical protein